jgi:signal transduction histidine kinase
MHRIAAATIILELRSLVSELSARSNREARVPERLAEEQAALRRIATLVARGIPPAELFSVVADEVARLLPADSALVSHLEPDSSFAVLAVEGRSPDKFAMGARFEVEPYGPIAAVVRTGRPARADLDQTDLRRVSAEVRERCRMSGVRSAVVTPIVVDGHLWGVIVACSKGELFPVDTEQRMLNFTELVATAIANAESRSELAASRARIVAASDETRRRLARDLHDGAQQRLVSIGLALRHAQHGLGPSANGTAATLEGALGEITLAIEELRELARGVHPAQLDDGLAPALRELAGRSPLVVEVSAGAERFPPQIEAAAYFIASEGLTNAVKHAAATKVTLSARKEAGCLVVCVSDDGKGGAEPALGSGLRGLSDRVEAHGGRLFIESGDTGTTLRAELPCAS